MEETLNNWMAKCKCERERAYFITWINQLQLLRKKSLNFMLMRNVPYVDFIEFLVWDCIHHRNWFYKVDNELLEIVKKISFKEDKGYNKRRKNFSAAVLYPLENALIGMRKDFKKENRRVFDKRKPHEELFTYLGKLLKDSVSKYDPKVGKVDEKNFEHLRNMEHVLCEMILLDAVTYRQHERKLFFDDSWYFTPQEIIRLNEMKMKDYEKKLAERDELLRKMQEHIVYLENEKKEKKSIKFLQSVATVKREDPRPKRHLVYEPFVPNKKVKVEERG